MFNSSGCDAVRITHAILVRMRTTVDLPEPLLRTAKRRAAERGVTLSELLGDALRGHLARRPAAIVPPFQLHTVRGRLVQPNLDLDRTSALLVRDDESEFAGKQGR
jgi:hypothetical protein